MNVLEIIRTKFTDTRTGAEHFGYRAYDKYGADFRIVEGPVPTDSLELIALASDANIGGEGEDSMIQSIFDTDGIIKVNGIEISNDVIKNYLINR